MGVKQIKTALHFFIIMITVNLSPFLKYVLILSHYLCNLIVYDYAVWSIRNEITKI